MKFFSRLQILIFFSISITLLTWSSFYTYSVLVQKIPQQAMNYWECIGSIDSKKNWDQHQTIMSRIYPLMKLDAQTNTTIARLHDWKAMGSEAWSEKAINARRKAVDYYRNVTELRPVWATGWLNLVKVKSLNQQFDDEVLSSLKNALFYGKNQTGIQSQIIWLALGMWDSLDKANQNNVRSLVQNLLSIGKKENFILITAFRFDWIEELNTLSANPDFIKRIDFFKNNQDELEKALNPKTAKAVCFR